MNTRKQVTTVQKMRKGELIGWLEAHNLFSLMRGWHDYTVDELRSEVLNEMGREPVLYK